MPTVGIHEARTQSGDASIRVEERDHPRKAPVARRGVLVQHVDVGGVRCADHAVVVRREAGTKGPRDHANLRESFANGGGRAVFGRVVEDDDVGVDAAQRLEARE